MNAQSKIEYDYNLQCWVVDGKVSECGHPGFGIAGCVSCTFGGMDIEVVRGMLDKTLIAL